ncbi:MAG: ROK family protein [Armatimonadetes bacterium]|nr:ROK family protein [Armatimonadota bacterium]
MSVIISVSVSLRLHEHCAASCHAGNIAQENRNRNAKLFDVNRGNESPHKGQSKMLAINKQALYILGVDLGGTNVRAAVTDHTGKILGSGRAPSNATEGIRNTVGRIADAAETAIASAGVKKSEIAGLGIGVPGHIDDKNGVVIWAPNFYEDGLPYRNVALAEPVTAQIGLPVIMGNDANVAALGEFRFGAGRDVQTMVMVTLGTGIGGGIILNGKLWTGANGGAGEIGHIIIAAGERGGSAAFGSLESMGQIAAIVERASRKICDGRKSILAERVGYDWHLLTPKIIADAAEEGDALAIETFEETGRYVGIGIASMINLLNPEMVVIGGGVSQAGDLILEPIRRACLANGIPSLVKSCPIVPATLGDDAGILGGVSLILDAIDG